VQESLRQDTDKSREPEKVNMKGGHTLDCPSLKLASSFGSPVSS